MTKKLSDKKIEEIREVYASGYSMMKTAEITGTYVLTVFKYVRDISRKNIGRTAWNKGKKCPQISKAKKGLEFSKTHKKNLSLSHKGNSSWLKGKKMPEYMRKTLQPYWDSLRNKTREKHPRWKGNRELRKLIREGHKNIEWRTSVFKRDKFICQHCGERRKLEAHHIISFSYILEEYNIKSLEDADNCDLFWDIDNGVTLCKSCHWKEHRKWKLKIE